MIDLRLAQIEVSSLTLSFVERGRSLQPRGQHSGGVYLALAAVGHEHGLAPVFLTSHLVFRLSFVTTRFHTTALFLSHSLITACDL